MADENAVAMTWGEVAVLTAQDNLPATRDRLYAVVAKFAFVAKAGNRPGDFPQRALAPRADQTAAVADYTALKAVVESVENATLAPDPALPKCAALLEVDQNGNLLLSGPVPSWVREATVVKRGIFQTGDTPRQFFQLFESSEFPSLGTAGYVSGLTGTGVPPAVVPVLPWYENWNWQIGLAAGFVFFLGLFSILWTATSFSQAYDLLAGRQIGQFKAFADAFPDCDGCISNKVDLTRNGNKLEGEDLQKALAAQQARSEELTRQGQECLVRLTDWGKDIKKPREPEKQPQDVKCLRIMGEAVAFASRNLVVPSDSWVEVGVQWVSWQLFSWHVPPPTTSTLSLAAPICLMMVSTVVVLVALGRGVTGRPLGALISPENRYSLALAQVTFWTVLVLTSVGALAVFNAGLGAEHLRDLPRPEAEGIALFPSIPNEIWAVLGISFVSPVLSSLIKGLKPDATTGSEVVVSRTGPASVTFLTSNTSGIVRDDLRRASIADWFLGEEGANKDKIDISRVQMVLVTAGLLVTYGSEIFAFTRDVMTAKMVSVIADPAVVLFQTLPPVGAAMAGLLLMSHATYLVAKASDKPPEKK